MAAIDDDLAFMLKIYCNPVTDHGLYLPNTPILPVGMTHEHPRFEEFIHDLHMPHSADAKDHP